jgi:hypothetical protein
MAALQETARRQAVPTSGQTAKESRGGKPAARPKLLTFYFAARNAPR